MLVGVAELAAAAVAGASGIGLCKLCRVRFRLSSFVMSAAEPDLLASFASAADGFELRGGNGVSGNNTFVHSFIYARYFSCLHQQVCNHKSSLVTSFVC